MKFALLLLTISLFSTHSFAQDASVTATTGTVTATVPAATTDTTVSTTPAVVPTPTAASTDTASSDGKKGDPKVIKMIEDKFNLSAEDIAKYYANGRICKSVR
jgi:hypothetical protein